MGLSASLEGISGRFTLLWGWKRAGAAFVAGAASAFAFQPFLLSPILLITIPILVWLMDATASDPAHGIFSKLRGAFTTGWWFGFGLFLGGLWWIGVAFLAEAGRFIWMMPFAVAGLPALLAVFTGIGTALARLFWRDDWRRLAVLAGSLSLADYLRSFVFSGFPWNLFGYAAMPVPLAMQSASLVGTHGVGLVLLALVALPALLAMPRETRGRGHRLFALLVLVLAVLHPLYGLLRISSISHDMVDGVSLRLVQPAIDQNEKWSPEAEAQVFRTLMELSVSPRQDAGAQDTNALSATTLLIWPESAFPFVLTERRDALGALAAMLPQETVLVSGALRVEKPAAGESRERVFNSVYTINGNGEITGAADKLHLVPFGEYLPFEPLLSSMGIEQLTHLQGGFEAGTARTLLDGGKAGSFLPLICYEIIFPREAFGESPRPDWVLNLTNDGWFGTTPGPWQHWHQAVVRGVEEGLPVVRVANNGISSVTDAAGRIVSYIAQGQRGVVESALPSVRITTFYSRYGNLTFLCFAAFFVFLGGFRQRNP
ncbi:MAG: apolipoprotein N-acyltransferase [Rhizobiaceae bacterium]